MTVAGSIDPVTAIALVAIIRPSSIAPESPMNIFAGLKLCGRKPAMAPNTTAESMPAIEK